MAEGLSTTTDLLERSKGLLSPFLPNLADSLLDSIQTKRWGERFGWDIDFNQYQPAARLSIATRIADSSDVGSTNHSTTPNLRGVDEFDRKSCDDFGENDGRVAARPHEFTTRRNREINLLRFVLLWIESRGCTL